MAIHVNIGEAKTQLSRLIRATLEGQDVFIDKAGQPLVRMIPADGRASIAERRHLFFGAWKGLIPDLDWEAPAYTAEEWDEILSTDDNLSG
jgi:antitoxin (DNA-binding transcriptional repressor) of toxin-antitoxin stability system